MKRYRVETRVTSTRVYFVDADNETEAEAASGEAQPEHEEEVNEETISIVEIPAAKG